MVPNNNTFYQRYGKRSLDIILSFLAIIILCPALALIALLVKINLGSPVIFCQPRPGKNEAVFNLYKFRTMTDDRDEHGCLLPDEKRLTAFGNFLRKTSLDELPELFCILTGKLSIVGPRPLLVEYLPLYNERQRIRHSVTPGLTGYAQVHGRNLLTWEEKFEMDIEYVQNITLRGDIQIVLQTIAVVFSQRGISSTTSVTMEPFHGSTEDAIQGDFL